MPPCFQILSCVLPPICARTLILLNFLFISIIAFPFSSRKSVVCCVSEPPTLYPVRDGRICSTSKIYPSRVTCPCTDSQSLMAYLSVSPPVRRFLLEVFL